MELNLESLEIQNWNILMDRAQRADEKNGVICLVSMFTPGSVVIKMSKMTYCLYFLLMIEKNKSQFWQNT